MILEGIFIKHKIKHDIYFYLLLLDALNSGGTWKSTMIKKDFKIHEYKIRNKRELKVNG